MLGMRQNNTPIKGEAAREIRMQMWRIASGHQNESDHQMASLRNEAHKSNRYEVVWKD